jgi:ribosomal protein S12 methylthiotransferase accessory factor
MEALEYAVAEHPSVEVLRASALELARREEAILDPVAALPLGETLEPARTISWVRGTRLRDGLTIRVPLDLVSLNGRTPDLPSLCQHTNGLASGNTAAEAMFHGACELVERDAATLWSLLDLGTKLSRCVEPSSFGDSLVQDLLERMEAAGLAVRLFDQTTDISVPTILAVCAPADGIVVKHFDVAAGAGTHPDAVRAALRAITEAAQTRITSIAGARDDVRPDAYRLDGGSEAICLVRAHPARATPCSMPPSRSADALLKMLIDRLAGAGIDDLVAVPLGGDQHGVSVVRMLSGSLEDRGPNANWRPGPRALAALLDS